MSVSAQEVKQVYAEADCLYEQVQVDAALDKMAVAINRDMQDQNPLVLCVLTGGIIPMGHLLTRLNIPLETDYVHASRYRGDIRGRELVWLSRPTSDIRGRNVLVVDDILDEGHTLEAIMAWCKEEGAESVCCAVLVDKEHDRKSGLVADYIGLKVEDRYIFGYGMDYKGYWRNAPGIYAVKDM